MKVAELSAVDFVGQYPSAYYALQECIRFSLIFSEDGMRVNASVRNHATLLYPQFVSRRRLPVNLDPDQLTLFSNELERIIPQTSLLEFQDVQVSSDGFLFKGKTILPESFAFPSQRAEWKRRSVLKFLASNHIFRRRRRLDSEVLWIVDQWSQGYFHWLTDALSRLLVVRDRLNSLVLMLPWEYETKEFVRSSLKAFPVKAVEFIGKREVLECRRLIMPTHTAPSGNYNDEIIRGVRTALLMAHAGTRDPPAGDKIYISRKLAGKRRITNEDEVNDILRQFEFETICAEELTFEQQVQICSKARYLVSNHGAGLTNMLFMSEGGSVLELRHHADRVNNCYFSLSSALNLNYFYQTCQSDNDTLDPHAADLTVDPRTLEKNLSLLLGTS